MAYKRKQIIQIKKEIENTGALTRTILILVVIVDTKLPHSAGHQSIHGELFFMRQHTFNKLF